MFFNFADVLQFKKQFNRLRQKISEIDKVLLHSSLNFFSDIIPFEKNESSCQTVTYNIKTQEQLESNSQ